MSTRGVIARKDGDGFTGRYHHWDSYPSGLGATLYDWAHKMPREKMLHMLLDEHPAGWSTIVGTDPSLTPGYVDTFDKNRRCQICGKPDWQHYRQYWGKDGYPRLPKKFAHIPGDVYLLTDHTPKPEVFPTDNCPHCYCHRERREEENIVTHQNAASMGCEYAYVFDGSGHTMTILSSYRANGDKMIGMFGMGDPGAAWRQIAVIDLDSPEPDWGKLV